MKIIGYETRRNGNSIFSLNVVDSLDSVYSVLVKSGLFNNADNYKKCVYTNGTTERINLTKMADQNKVKFKVVDGDWLIIVNDANNIVMYICEQYCGQIKVKNKKVQDAVNSCYTICRERIESKHNFAKEMGAISRKLNLPFQIVLAFKGNEELLNQMTKNIEQAICVKSYENKRLMQLLVSSDIAKKEEVIRSFGIVQLPTYQVEKVANYIFECLENKKIIRRYE